MIAHNDPLGATSPRIKVQVKRRSESKIGREGISAFAGTLGATDVGIYVSAGGFTTEAEREARSSEGRRITLVDLNFAWIKDRTFLDAAPDLGLLDKGEKDTLVEALGLRNWCGHPTQYKSGVQKARSYIEDVVGIVFA